MFLRFCFCNLCWAKQSCQKCTGNANILERRGCAVCTSLYNAINENGVCGGLAVVFRTAKGERSEVHTPARAEIWIGISASCAPLLCLLDNKLDYTRASPKPGTHLRWGRKGQANGCRYFGHKEKTRKKSNDTGTKKKTIIIIIIIIFVFQISGCQTAPWFTMCALSLL